MLHSRAPAQRPDFRTGILASIALAALCFSPVAPGTLRADTGVTGLPGAIAPLPSLIDFATAKDLPLTGIQFANKDWTGPRGDHVVLLITLDGKSGKQQWLAGLEMAGLSPQEQKSAHPETQVIFTSTGRELHFPNTRTALRLTFVGPFLPDVAAETSRFASQLDSPRRLFASSEYLNAGLDKYGALALRLAERSANAGVKHNELFYIGSSKRLSEADLENGKRYIEVVNPTVEEERVVFSVAFALNSLLGSALDEPAFKKVVGQVLRTPSTWSIVKSFGVGRHLAYDPANVRRDDLLSGALGLPVYRMPITLFLNGTVALEADVFYTAARPPLETCAGIVRIHARHPVECDHTLTIELLAACPGKRSP